MKKIRKDIWIILIIILFIAILAIIVLKKNSPETDAKTAKCIGSKSILYVQLGCSHCKTQEEMFGENYQYLNVTDCFYQEEKCGNITGTPTWIINGEAYLGVQSIDKLKELTGC